MERCLNVIVFYNNREEVEKYIDDVNRIGNNSVDIAVVFNSDINKEAPSLKKSISLKYQNVTYWDFGENVGYLNSLLYVISELNDNEYKYVILSNTDIEYRNGEFFSNLLAHRYKDSIGCIAPSIYAKQTNSFSNPHNIERFSKEKVKGLIFIFSHPMLAKIYIWLSSIKSRTKKAVERQEEMIVYSPHGCYMIFSRKFIDLIKGFEYGVKMYSEEACVGELLLKNKMICLYDPSLKATHNERSVTGKVNFSQIAEYYKESLTYILKEFY